jgi:hypothetical protein
MNSYPPFGTILLNISLANQHSFQFSVHLVPMLFDYALE